MNCRDYLGDRPNLIWNQFLSRLFPSGTNFCPKVSTHPKQVTKPTTNK